MRLADIFVGVQPRDLKPSDLRNALSKGNASKAGQDEGGKFSKGFSSGLKSLVGAATVALAGAQVGKQLKDAVGRASDLNETVSKTNQVFGSASGAIQKFAADAPTRLGQTKQAALDANATFGLFGKTAGLSGVKLSGFTTKLTTLASDMASFSNTSPEQAIDAIGAALRGESEPIRAYGVLLDDATLKAEAMSLGLVKTSKDVDKIKAAQLRSLLASKKYNDAVKEHGKNSKEALSAEAGLATASGALKKAVGGTVPALTQQQKVLAAQSVILKQTKDAQGDFARTSGGLANQQRIAAAQTDALKVKIGTALLPVVLAGAKALNTQLLPPLIKLADKYGPKLGASLSDLATKAGPALTGFLDKIGPAFHDLSSGTSDASPALSSLADSGAKLGPVFKDLSDKVPSLTDALNVGATAIGFFADHTDTLAKLMPVLVGAIVAYKVAQLAANVAAVFSVPTKFAEVVVNRQLVKSNRELIVSRAGLVVSTGTETVATEANTVAKSSGILASIRMRAVQIAQATGTVIATVATKAATVGMYLLGAAVRFATGPVGLIILGIAAMVAGLIYAYKNSETFRDIVNGVFTTVRDVAVAVFKAVVGAVKFAIDWVKANWPLLLAILTGPFGLAAYAIARNWDTIKSAAQSALRFVVLKVLDFAGDIVAGAAKAFGWVPGLGDKLKAASVAMGKFRDDVNRKLGGIEDQNINFEIKYSSTGVNLTTPSSVGRRATGGPGGKVRGPGGTKDDKAGIYALSNTEWVINAAASAEQGDRKMAALNAGKATIVPDGGFAKGGRPGLNLTRTGADAASLAAAAEKSIAASAKATAKILAANRLGGTMAWGKTQIGKPYGWGTSGPDSYDCSGFVSALINYSKGRNPYSRLGATGSMPWADMSSGTGQFMVGWFQGNPGHTAATIRGVNYESAGGVGVRVGGNARGAYNSLFTNRAKVKGFAKGGTPDEGRKGDLPFDLVDPRGDRFMGPGFLKQMGISVKDKGGVWKSGTLAANLSGHNETVVAGGNDDGSIRLDDDTIRRMAEAFAAAVARTPVMLDSTRVDRAMSSAAIGGGF